MDGVKGAVSVWDGAAALSRQPGGGDVVVRTSTALNPSLARSPTEDRRAGVRVEMGQSGQRGLVQGSVCLPACRGRRGSH